jgi:3-deoxy-D-manno-octulosonic-acid transferase
MRQRQKVQELLYEKHGLRCGEHTRTESREMLLNFLYCLALWIASPLVIYRAARFGRYRRGVRQKFLGLRYDDLGLDDPGFDPRSSRPVAWFHAVSVGEVNLLAGLVQSFRTAHPEYQVVISTTTDTGYDLAKSRFSELPIFFCPLDFTWAVNRTFETLRPQLLVLAELEVWPNLIRYAGQWRCCVAVANGRLSERSSKKYLRYARVLAPTFARLDWVGCQDEEYAARFIACGTRPSAVTITGSIKFDDAPTTRDTPEVHRIARWTGTDPWHQVLMAGSTHSGEEAAALATYRELSAEYRELRLVIVPRHRERFQEVAELIEASGFDVRRRSETHAPVDHWPASTVVLVDSVGELRHWWGISRIAFVGGGFADRGGQNMLEPAGYGSAVCFGPNTRNFEDIARRLELADAAVRLNDPAELTQFVARCLHSPPAADSLGIQARKVVTAHRGATAKTISHLTMLLAAAHRRQESRAA